MPNGITVIAAYYQKFIRSLLHPQIWKLQPEKMDSGVLITPHVAQPVVNLFIYYAWKTLHHLRYGSDFSLPDCGLFPKIKKPLCRTHFGSLDELSLANTRKICHLKE